MPTKKELMPYVHQIEAGAKKFKKSSRTIRRWLVKYKIYKPQTKYMPRKIDKKKASKIRSLEGQMTQTEIAIQFNISQSMVGKILNNIYHKQTLRLTGTSVTHFTF